MTQRPMIEFYVQSHSAEDDVMDSTAAHTSVILNRVFDMLERDYGVTITADAVNGKDEPKIVRGVKPGKTAR